MKTDQKINFVLNIRLNIRLIIRMSVCLLLFFCLLVFYSSDIATANSVTSHWKELHGTLNDTLAMLEEKQSLPDNSWIPFKKDKKSLNDKIDDLLDEAIDILNISELSTIKQQINQCYEKIKNSKKSIAKFRTEKMMAPEDKAAWKIWVNNVKDYEKKIDAHTQNITENEKAIKKLKKYMKQAFQDIGIDLNIEQMDTLLYSVTGDDDIEIVSVFNNIKIITVKLKELTESSVEDIETAKRYYGMHTLLLKILLNLQKNYIDRVNNQYLTNLTNIENENQQLMQTTHSLLNASEPQHQKMYKANLEAQQLTNQAVGLYRQYLTKNKNRMKQAVNKIYKEYQVAENTYLTVSTAYALIAMMREADNLYNSISELQVPDLLVFDNNALKAEFKKLSDTMGTEK